MSSARVSLNIRLWPEAAIRLECRVFDSPPGHYFHEGPYGAYREYTDIQQLIHASAALLLSFRRGKILEEVRNRYLGKIEKFTGIQKRPATGTAGLVPDVSLLRIDHPHH